MSIPLERFKSLSFGCSTNFEGKEEHWFCSLSGMRLAHGAWVLDYPLIRLGLGLGGEKSASLSGTRRYGRSDHLLVAGYIH